MTDHHSVELTANFELNLEEIEAFLADAGALQAFDALLNELTDTVVYNLERFPEMGRSFLERPLGSVEASNGVARLTGQLNAIGEGSQLREYLTSHYLLLYVTSGSKVYLLSIRHHRQLSFDLEGHWPM